MTLPRHTPVSSAPQPPPMFRGVYDIDPADMPPPPPGARAVIVVDSKGVTVGFSWVVLEQSSDLPDEAWNWLDKRDKPTLLSMPRHPLRLEP